jgi:hypothetical protein
MTNSAKTTDRELPISARIDSLLDEAVAAGDADMASQCRLAADHELYDSDTAEEIVPEDMFPREKYPMVRYVAAICTSLNEGTDEGHVRINGLRVYAA